MLVKGESARMLRTERDNEAVTSAFSNPLTRQSKPFEFMISTPPIPLPQENSSAPHTLNLSCILPRVGKLDTRRRNVIVGTPRQHHALIQWNPQSSQCMRLISQLRYGTARRISLLLFLNFQLPGVRAELEMAPFVAARSGREGIDLAKINTPTPKEALPCQYCLHLDAYVMHVVRIWAFPTSSINVSSNRHRRPFSIYGHRC